MLFNFLVFLYFQVKCEYCDLSINRKNLKRHIDSQHLKTIVVFKCKLCVRSGKKSALIKHQRNLNRHMRNVHEVAANPKRNYSKLTITKE